MLVEEVRSMAVYILHATRCALVSSGQHCGGAASYFVDPSEPA